MDRPTEIGASIIVRGELTAKEDILISGRVEGTIHSEGQLVTIKPGAHVEADALAREIVVAGRVGGSRSPRRSASRCRAPRMSRVNCQLRRWSSSREPFCTAASIPPAIGNPA